MFAYSKFICFCNYLSSPQFSLYFSKAVQIIHFSNSRHFKLVICIFYFFVGIVVQKLISMTATLLTSYAKSRDRFCPSIATLSTSNAKSRDRFCSSMIATLSTSNTKSCDRFCPIADFEQ